ncbi:MAG: ferredoxin--NADP reductase [Tepidiphilus sp.]|jgi:ferredoxin--NADP+ reductase|uniref:Ferredoxin--NADP reductase n=1 Tax=Tepidiphilus thermophilus TaxID=876478 RepID=A0A0K6IPK8_9PROT|nr:MULTISPECIES: ferredoxin--NADP reductase [Tepidiphilus]MBP6998061.1 ferredoxin--NADP reductase [Tepidiphilus sp.]MDK2796759.1 ferredoxin/flavodoxin---NADP+ reductase [Tepidiphilus sp.]CUB05232.1 Ferredoxin-NADP reductase [Tepidiphilus thermophilus]
MAETGAVAEQTSSPALPKNLRVEKVIWVHHWTDTLFSFRCTRDPGFRFINGQFVMIGLMVDGKPLLRAYSIASANWEEHLEFYSIKVPNGPLTSRLQHLKVGDEVLVSTKPTGTLVQDNLLPGAKRLFLLATGTGLAPFMSIIKDPDVYDRYEKVILVHCTRWVRELGYYDYITKELPQHEFLGEMVREKLIYYPTVTREPFIHQGRITDLITSGKLAADLGIPQLNPETDRALLCGSMRMLADTSKILDDLGFQVSPSMGVPGHYAIERAFVDQ